MARARNIKPGFFKNEFLAEMPCEARLLFIGLWTLADREGRLEDRPKRIKAELFAFDSFDVDSMLNLLQRDMFVLRYEVDGVRFIQIENFVKHQDPHYKEKASEIPAPDGRDNLILASGVTRTQRARIYERDGYACQSCDSKEHLCIDHVLPVSRGGDSSDGNLQTLCMSCNTRKGNKLDGEEKNSRQRRINVASKSSQQNDASPSDSLIPDSLNPITDSLNPITEEKQTAQKARLVGVSEVFEFWKSSMGHDRAKLDSKRSKQIADALKLGYTLEDLKNAIIGCTLSAYHMGDNDKGAKYDSLSLILRDAGKIDQFIGYFNSPPVKQSSQPAKTQYQINQEATTRALFGSMLPSALNGAMKTIEGEVMP